ncbi:hypothetical protein [Treponema pedis]|uniref:hypothetical protein n=1 Tax=Treponema pedis TaxID=409322 RepID=UPI0003FFAE44|nr:hypothetical protein [Treponema pedis]
MKINIDDIHVVWNEDEYEKSLIEKILIQDYENMHNYLSQCKAIDKSINKNINIEIKKPMFGFHNCGMRRGFNITLFGVEECYLIHELTHIYMPSNNFILHEGTADFLQETLAKKKRIWGGYSFCEIPYIQYGNRFSKKTNDFKRFLKNNENYNDSRLNKCLFSRACAAIISRKVFFDETRAAYIEDEIKALERSLIESPIINTSFDSYFVEKNTNMKIWKSFEKFGIKKDGHPLENWKNIDEKVRDEVFLLYNKELRMDSYPLNCELWNET